jgi:hypothetical protein
MDYQTYLPQLQMIAKTYSKQLDYDEALSIVNTAYVESTLSHDKNKSLFSTWLNTQANGRCKSAIKKNLNFNNIKHSFFFSTTNPPCSTVERSYICQHQSAAFWQMVEKFSRDAKIIVGVVLDPPKELIEFILTRPNKKHTRNLNRQILCQFLRGLGWSWQRAHQTFNEIKQGLESI